MDKYETKSALDTEKMIWEPKKQFELKTFGSRHPDQLERSLVQRSRSEFHETERGDPRLVHLLAHAWEHQKSLVRAQKALDTKTKDKNKVNLQFYTGWVQYKQLNFGTTLRNIEGAYCSTRERKITAPIE